MKTAVKKVLENLQLFVERFSDVQIAEHQQKWISVFVKNNANPLKYSIYQKKLTIRGFIKRNRNLAF